MKLFYQKCIVGTVLAGLMGLAAFAVINDPVPASWAKANVADVVVVPAELPILDINNPVITQSCRLPDGDIRLKKPITATNLEKIHLVGGNRSRILWEGDDPIAAIKFIGVRKGSIGGDGTLGFEIVCLKNGCNAGVLLANSPIHKGFISSGIQVRNVHIRHGGQNTAFTKGFSIDSHICDPTGSGHGFNNNENHRFFNCSVESCLKAAYHIRGHQCYDISFRDCEAIDAGRVVNGVHVRNWIYGVWVESGASVILKNCSFNRCEYDVFMGWPCGRCTFEGHNSEHGRCLVANCVRNPETGNLITGATTSDYYIHCRDIRFACEPRAKMPVVDMFGRGPITITNSFFNGINGVAPFISTVNSNKIGPGGVHVPLRGRINIEDVSLGQYGGTLPTYPLIRTPSGWYTRVSNVEHKRVLADGSVEWRPVSANQPIPIVPDN